LISLLPEGVRPENLCIEISEQQFIGDPTYLRDHVLALKKEGIQVAIDDVGFGRSSLESLIILEPDIVKIDRKYVSGVADEPAKARLLKRLVKVVQALGAELVAEGIEQREELEMLVELGVRYGQGWYWGKPS
jgi:EAL domain-containing protein (putative c-di-GMP-specific phosphodiesterase class I)